MNGGNYVMVARRQAHLTQRELAERIGHRQATIARWERGDRFPSYEDVQSAVGACGLALDVQLVPEDRSWWPQIAAQLDRTPDRRVRHLTPAGAFDAMSLIEVLAETSAPAIILGELGGALHGWPLVLTGSVELCVRGSSPAVDAALKRLDARVASDDTYALPGDGKLIITETPPGTSGFSDLARGATPVMTRFGVVKVAGLLDLLRIAGASKSQDARRQRLAYCAVLDVQQARRSAPSNDDLSDAERIEKWLNQQTQMA
jgi:transcriptional regulator with XRE-family HTH domain